MKIVICATLQEFRSYCEENKLNPHDPRVVKWIRNRIDLLGYHNVEIVLHGNYYMLEEWFEIREEIKRINR